MFCMLNHFCYVHLEYYLLNILQLSICGSENKWQCMLTLSHIIFYTLTFDNLLLTDRCPTEVYICDLVLKPGISAESLQPNTVLKTDNWGNSVRKLKSNVSTFNSWSWCENIITWKYHEDRTIIHIFGNSVKTKLPYCVSSKHI